MRRACSLPGSCRSGFRSVLRLKMMTRNNGLTRSRGLTDAEMNAVTGGALIRAIASAVIGTHIRKIAEKEAILSQQH
jgi:hypothetical protein